MIASEWNSQTGIEKKNVENLNETVCTLASWIRYKKQFTRFMANKEGKKYYEKSLNRMTHLLDLWSSWSFHALQMDLFAIFFLFLSSFLEQNGLSTRKRRTNSIKPNYNQNSMMSTFQLTEGTTTWFKKIKHSNDVMNMHILQFIFPPEIRGKNRSRWVWVFVQISGEKKISKGQLLSHSNNR